MYIDAFGLVSDSQAVTATAFSTHTIDLTNVSPKRDVSTGEPVGFGVNVEAALGGTTPTLSIEAVQSDNANLASPDVIGSITPTQAQLGVGALHFVSLGTVTKRYIGLRYTTGGTSPTITVSAWYGPRDLFSKVNTHYAKAYAV